MANCQLPPPDAMVCTGSVAENWKIFKEAYNDFATAMQLTTEDNKIQAATLKTVMGKECRQILSCLELSNEDKKKPSKILEKLEEYYFFTHQKRFVRAIPISSPISLGKTTAEQKCGPIYKSSMTLGRVL